MTDPISALINGFIQGYYLTIYSGTGVSAMTNQPTMIADVEALLYLREHLGINKAEARRSHTELTAVG